MNDYIHLMPPAYYDTLIEWELMDEIIGLVDEQEKAETYQLVSQMLDYIVLETVLSNLQKTHHFEFLELCSHQHHEPSLLNWLEERQIGITQTVKIALSEAKLEVKNILISS